MYAKRKFSRDDDDVEEQCYTQPKQLKLATAFQDNDVCMSDVPHSINAVPFPSFAYADSPSSSSCTDSPSYSLSSLPSGSDSPNYPQFELYPEVQIGMDVDFTPRTHRLDSQPALLQPTSGAFQHGSHCTQIPRLRMSSHPGLNGTRTMWSHCQSCGAIEMVLLDFFLLLSDPDIDSTTQPCTNHLIWFQYQMHSQPTELSTATIDSSIPPKVPVISIDHISCSLYPLL